MPVYAITGKLGSGKGKSAVLRLRDEYLRKGRRVAGNLDLFMEHLDHERSRATYTRLPDKPSASDLYALGSGNKFVEFENAWEYKDDAIICSDSGFSPKILPGFDESQNGALFLDECGSWLNTRNFQDKGRSALLEYFIHARKYGWDIYFIMQNVNQADKQLRESLFEYVVRANRLDRMRVPVVSSAINAMTAGAVSGQMPRMHIAVVRIGSSPDGLVADRWVFRGDDLNAAYNTTQVFSDNYPHGMHSLLSPWHLSAKVGIPPAFVGPVRPGPADLQLLQQRVQPLKPPHKHMTKFLSLALCLGLLLGAGGMYFFKPDSPSVQVAVATSPVAAPGAKAVDPVKGIGFFKSGFSTTVILSDGTVHTPKSFTKSSTGEWTAVLSSGVVVSGADK